MKNVLSLFTMLAIGLASFAQTVNVTFNMDMSNSDFPNADYDNVVINGSWNAWGAWGITLADEDGDGIWSGSAEFDQNS